ncbi:MAG: hypothetical protein AAF202_05485 [Pseudomonadota bacterium]
MMKPAIVFLGCERVPVTSTDDILWINSLKERGYTVLSLDWRTPLDQFPERGVCLPRTTWDYFDHLEEFLEKLTQLEARGLQVINALETVRWNCDKLYLKRMSERGVPTLPSFFIGESEQSVDEFFQQHPAEEYLLKPRVGAGGFGFQKFSMAKMKSVLGSLSGSEGPLFVQPVLNEIKVSGEKSLMYSMGKPTHAVQKLPGQGEIRIQEEWGGSTKLYEPSKEERALADRLIQEYAAELLYARVDLMNASDGRPLLMELELIEPSLYFRYLPEISETYAASLVAAHLE